MLFYIVIVMLLHDFYSLSSYRFILKTLTLLTVICYSVHRLPGSACRAGGQTLDVVSPYALLVPWPSTILQEQVDPCWLRRAFVAHK